MSLPTRRPLLIVNKELSRRCHSMTATRNGKYSVKKKGLVAENIQEQK